MGEARRRRLAKEAGSPWGEDLPKPAPAVLPASPEVRRDFQSEGVPIIVQDPRHAECMAMVQKICQLDHSLPVIIMRRPAVSIQTLTVDLLKSFSAEPLVGRLTVTSTKRRPR